MCRGNTGNDAFLQISRYLGLFSLLACLKYVSLPLLYEPSLYLYELWSGSLAWLGMAVRCLHCSRVSPIFSFCTACLRFLHDMELINLFSLLKNLHWNFISICIFFSSEIMNESFCWSGHYYFIVKGVRCGTASSFIKKSATPHSSQYLIPFYFTFTHIRSYESIVIRIQHFRCITVF